MKQINTAILSYGLSGKVFQAPFLTVHPGFRLAGAWERSKHLFLNDYPDATRYESLEAILEDESIELVVVNTPIFTHFDYARQALEKGKHVVVEKAFTTTAAEAQELKELADRKGLVLAVFQNRRWDSDYKTVKKVVQEQLLGDLQDVFFRYNRYKPEPGPKWHRETPGAGAGQLKDLGPHLIDQALHLFGMPESLFADLRTTRAGSLVDDWFELKLYYPNNLRVNLKSSLTEREDVIPAYILQGTKGSFIKGRTDMQEALLLEGNKPDTADWYTEPESDYGLLHTELNGEIIRRPLKSERGDYRVYFDQLYLAIATSTPPPVTAADGVKVMQLMEAAILSNQEGRKVNF